MESSSNRQQVRVAPFVAKTYQMVSDPRTDYLIRWGRENNSFLVLDPSEFSRRLLPVYFRHNSFSSFVRQLNTYGFRKVDFDRWEFAHVSFLRGQFHLLPNIVRWKKSNVNNGVAGGSSSKEVASDEEQMALLLELGRLRREQRALEEDLRTMSKRLHATEGRSQRMMSFLARVVEDPGLLARSTLAKQSQQQHLMEKRRRLWISPLPPAPSYPQPPVPPPTKRTGFYPFNGGVLTVNPFDIPVQPGTVAIAGAVGDGLDNPAVAAMSYFSAAGSAMVVDNGGETLSLPTTGEWETSAAADGTVHGFSSVGHEYY